jgi:hypothetical protein
MNPEQQRAYWRDATTALLARQAAAGLDRGTARRRLRLLLQPDGSRAARRARLSLD